MANNGSGAGNKPGMFNKYTHPFMYKCLLFARNGIVVFIGFFLVFLLLSGAINQVKTGQNIIDYAMGIGHNIANFFESIVDNDSGLKITDDGVYFDDAEVPEEGALE